MREGLQGSQQERPADCEGLVDGCEVERTRVEGAGRVGVVDELHVDAGGLLGGCGEVVEVVGVAGALARPVGVDLEPGVSTE